MTNTIYTLHKYTNGKHQVTLYYRIKEDAIEYAQMMLGYEDIEIDKGVHVTALHGKDPQGEETTYFIEETHLR